VIANADDRVSELKEMQEQLTWLSANKKRTVD
jgi:hypothetical protein